MRHFTIAPILALGIFACSAAPDQGDVDTIGEEAICQDCGGGSGAGGAGTVGTCSSVCGANADCSAECQESPGVRTTCGAKRLCRTCANFCSSAIACSNSCKLPNQSVTTCEAYGSCKRYDTYCAYPVIVTANVSDIHESFVGGNEAYMYFASASGPKEGTFHSVIGGNQYDPASAWASNFRGPLKVTGESFRPQWEWFDGAPNGHTADFSGTGTPYLYGKVCRSVVAGAAFPSLGSKTETVWEDDECFGPFCNGDDQVGSFTIDRDVCFNDVFSSYVPSGWSSVRNAAVGGDISAMRYRNFCYSCKNAPNASCSTGVQP
jgi:hypothetical protein